MIIRRIDGHVVMRPAEKHPDCDHWISLRAQRLAHQNGYCSTCWRHESAHPMDLHHRHYNTFGQETLHCVVILCRSCHEAITSRIRSERFALGDRSLETNLRPGHIPPQKPDVAQPQIVEFRAEIYEARFRP